MHEKVRKWWLPVTLGAAVVGIYLARRKVDRRTIQRKFWQPFYNHFASVYDVIVEELTGYTTHRLRRKALAYLPEPGSRVLEVGFGNGRLHEELAGEYHTAGVDRAFGMARLTQERLAEAGRSSALVKGDAEALPWRDGAFDAVLSTFAFSAIPGAEHAMDEMVRVTAPGGKVIIVDAGDARSGSPAAYLMARLMEAIGDYMRDEVPLMEARGLETHREDYGPFATVHVTVGTKAG